MAVGDVYSEILGSRYVSVGLPATENQAGYAAKTWTRIRGVVRMPQRGDSLADIAEGTLDEGRTYHTPGQADGGVLEIPILYIEGDAGQALLQANRGNGATICWQEVDPDGVAYFFHGKVLGMPRRESTNQSNKGFICRFGVNSDRLTGVPDLT